MNEVFFKVCTTGLDKDKDRIVSLDYKIGDNSVKRLIVKPDKDFAYREDLNLINSLTKNQIIEQGIPFQEAISQFIDEIGQSTIIGHNICTCALTFIKNELRHIEKPEIYTKIWTNKIIDLFNLLRTISQDRSFSAIKKQFSKDESKSDLEILHEIYPIILNNISKEEKLSNELSPSGWLKIKNCEGFFAKGKFNDMKIDDFIKNPSQSYLNFILINSEPHTIRCLKNWDKLKNILKKL